MRSAGTEQLEAALSLPEINFGRIDGADLSFAKNPCPRVGAIDLISVCGCQSCTPPITINRADTYPRVRIRGGVERSKDMETFAATPVLSGPASSLHVDVILGKDRC